MPPFFLQQQQQQEESVEDEDDDQQLRLEVPSLASTRTTDGDGRRQQQQQQQSDPHENDHAARDQGGGGEVVDLDVMSATSWTRMGHVQPSYSASSQRERRAQIDSCWCNIPDMFVDPSSRAAYYWMALVTIAVVYNWIVIILRVAFEDMRDNEFHQKAFRVLDTISDVIYLMDVAIQSRTAYLEDGCLVKSLPETVRHYRSQSYFPLDVLSVVPVTTVLSHLSKIGLPCPFESGFSSLTTPGLRFLRLLKYPSMTRFFEKTDSHTNNPNLLRAFRLSLHLWLVIHWIGCFYYLVSRYEGLGTNDWVFPDTAEFSTFRRKYIYSMYWSTMTLTTIGERPWPVTDVEYIFTGLTFLIGVFVFAAVVGNVGDVISNMNAARQDFQARMDQIKFYLNHRNIPDHLQDQIKRWAEYTWARTKAIDEHSVLQLLPSRLRTEVAIHVHLKTLKKVRIFEQCEEGLLRELVLKLRPSIYSPGEYICRIGEIGREMYIIDHGKVEILFPEHGSGQMKQVAVMMPGNYFGEISLLKLDDGQNKRTADVRSVGFSELLCLSRRDLMSALMEYPEAKKILETQARERMHQTKQTQEMEPGHPGVPQPSGSAHNVSAGFKSGRRSARAVFAQVMKQEGFSKLLASTANEELTEMKNILKELREIKSQLSQARVPQELLQGGNMERQLQRIDDLQQIRRQWLMQTGAMVTSGSNTSSSASNLTSTADLSSDAIILTSPTATAHGRQTAIGEKPSCARNLPLPPKPSMQNASSDFMAQQPQYSAEMAKALSPFGCSMPPQIMTTALIPVPAGTSSPEAVTLPSRRRRASSCRSPKSVDKDQLENTNTMAEGVLDTNPSLAVAEGGGGDEPAVLNAEKEPLAKDLGEERTGQISAKNSISTDNRCKESLPSLTSLGSNVGGCSDVEFLFRSSANSSSQDKQRSSRRPTAVRASSKQLQLLAPSDSLKSLDSTSSYSTASYSTTSTSSGGRGHSPKPAKPRPRYRKEELPNTCGHATKEENTKCLGDTNHSQSHTHGNVGMCSKDSNDKLGESHMSSEGFSTTSICSIPDSNSPDAVKSSSMKSRTGSSLFSFAEAECANNNRDQYPWQTGTETDESECLIKTTTYDTKTKKRDMFSKPAVDTLELIQGECLSSRTNSCVEKRASPGGERGLLEQVCVSKKSVSAQVTGDDSSPLQMVGVLGENVFHSDGDTQQEDSSEGSGDSYTEGKQGFIPATRAKSDCNKVISLNELADIHRTMRCRMIDDNQLSVILAKRREVSDSADYTMESPGRALMSSVNAGILESEHSHSVHTVITPTTVTRITQESEQRAQKQLELGNEKQMSGGTDKSSNIAQVNGGKHKLSSELTDTTLPSGNTSHYVNVVCSEVSTVSADLCQQSASAVQDDVFHETLTTEHADSVMSGESKTAGHVSRDTHIDHKNKIGTANKHPFQSTEDEDRQYDGTNTPIVQSKGELDRSSLLEDTLLPTASEVDGGHKPPLPHPDARHCSAASRQPENCVELLTKSADEKNKHRAVKDSCRELSHESSNGVRDSEGRPDTTQRSRNGKVEQHQDQSVLKFEGVEPCPLNVTHYNKEEQQNETLPTQRRHCSPQCCRQGLEKEASYHGAFSHSVSHVSKDDISVVSTSTFPRTVDGKLAAPTRKHSEKLNALIATFDTGMKRCEKDDLKNDTQKNYTISFTETKTTSHPDIKIVSKEPAEGEGNLVEKDKEIDSVEGSVLSATSYHPVRHSPETGDCTGLRNSSLLTPSPAASPPKIRKSLRLRGLTKRTYNPCGRKEGRMYEQTCENGADTASSAQHAHVTVAGVVPTQEPEAENITTQGTPVKTLLGESGKKPSCTDHDRESQFCIPANDRPHSSQVQDMAICSSDGVECKQLQCSVLQTCSLSASGNLIDAQSRVSSGETGHGEEPHSNMAETKSHTILDQHCNTTGGNINSHHAGASDYAAPVDPEPGNANEASAAVPDHRQETAQAQAPSAVTTPEDAQHPNEQESGSHTATGSSHRPQDLLLVPENPAAASGGSVPALHLYPALLDSPGASFSDDSTGEMGEKEAEEAMGSLILLADFGVEDDDDDEGALSGLSDPSDINSDLDDL
ncbi:uncharacterized protein LOC143295844 [Babylonia areolata]|uniref:uncharacterized protein LOC143295844 n=1 Tax=Babylonia areolata TaxID=304850 RepID=UPI003FD06D64